MQVFRNDFHGIGEGRVILFISLLEGSQAQEPCHFWVSQHVELHALSLHPLAPQY